MSGIVLSALADAPVDPAAVQPDRLSSLPFLFVGIVTVLLMLSMIRHLRRVQANFLPDPDQ